MRFTTYTKYRPGLLDALNLEALLEHLTDFLMDGGFAGGPHFHPYWGWSGTEDTSSYEALQRAILDALIESGQLTAGNAGGAARRGRGRRGGAAPDRGAHRRHRPRSSWRRDT